MATGIGNLPYPMPPVSPFDVITSQAENEKIANIESIADGSGIGDGAITSGKVNYATFVPAMRATATGEQPITTGSFKAANITLQAGVVYLVHASIDWTIAGGGNKIQAFRVNGTTIDSHRIEGVTQTNMTLLGLYRPSSTMVYTFDINISNISGATTGTIGVVRYNAAPLMTTASIG